MFYKSGILMKSDVFAKFNGVRHGFSTREGGISTLPHTSSLNLGKKLGDDNETVFGNTDIFAHALTDGALGGECAVIASQVHSAKVCVITRDDCGEGFFSPSEECDGFVTDSAGVIPIIRTADCVPILLCGEKADGSPVVGAVHAGWHGTVDGIAGEAVRLMSALGCVRDTVCAAVGAHIGYCCYEVGEDFYASVAELRGEDFAKRHITVPVGGHKYHADLTSMNLEILCEAGIGRERIDISPDCTMCLPDIYYSHRAGGGRRGVMGAGIVII